MVNTWWEVQVLCDPLLEEIVFWRLADFGCSGSASHRQGNASWVMAYLPKDQAHVLDLAALSLLLRQDALCIGLPVPAVQWQLIDEEDWASSWKQHWQPQNIGDRLLIYPAWLPVPETSDRLLLRLEPGTAFGTGDHPTTQLCLEALEMRLGSDAPNQVVADVGCGSGILSIGALLLGAKQVYAADTDPLAVKATRENRVLNGFAEAQLVVEQGSVDRIMEVATEPIDGIVCNILAEVIIDLVPAMTALANINTWGILSGILVEQAKPVADILEENHWLVAALWKRKDWCCLNIRRS